LYLLLLRLPKIENATFKMLALKGIQSSK